MGKRGQRKANGEREETLPNVLETTRIQITKRLEEFRAGDAEVYTFEPNLTNPERAVVHELCRKMGMVSKSSGRGKQRCVSVYKSKKKQVSVVKGKENVTCLTFSEETKDVLRDLFTNYPPDDGELNEETPMNYSGNDNKGQGKQDSSFCRPSMGKAEIAKKVDLLASRINEAPHLRKIIEDRSKLPIVSFKDVITSTLESHQVVLVSGETGCGKTTQIRLESKGGKNSSIVFCTNGILLRMLIGMGAGTSNKEVANESLKDVFEITHIIVDEIHERDRFADFMLAILRDLLPFCPHLRLILMSATINAERFSQYFGSCPIIRVPGFTYPVKTFYLEDVLSILGLTEGNHLDPSVLGDADDVDLLTDEYRTALDESIDLALSSDEFDLLLELVSTSATPKIYNYQHSLTGASPLMVFARKGRIGDVCRLLSLGADCYLCAKDGSTALHWAQQENQDEVVDILKKHMENDISRSAEVQQLLEKYLASVNPEHIDTVLIERLLRKICIDSKEGAILVFLPGWDDINQTRERLLASPFFKDSSKFLIISLHSMIPSVEQKKVFRRPPAGTRKIILSTNIAETAVTIDDVVYVIDSGRMKEKSYDPYNNVSTLHSAWVSKASAKQRQGRAGRCQPGICYHLYSKTRAASLPDFQVPEIKRIPIEDLCLQVKMLNPHCKIVDFIQKTLDPPVFETIRNAVIVLQDIGALTHDEKLTELGKKLGSLPVHPSTSKMLFFAILMNCLDPALTLACASDYRDPFLLPMAPDEKKRATAAKLELSSLYGGHSDQLTIIAAFECWRCAKNKGQEAQFCSRYFVSSSTMNMLFSMRKQLQSELAKNGFIPEDASKCSLNAQDPGILHAVLVAGTYPMVGRLLPPRRNNQRAVVETASGAKVRLHPHSSNFKLSFSKSIHHRPLIIYDEITRGDGGMYIKKCTVVGPYPLLLLATEMVVAPAHDSDDGSDDDAEDSGSEDDEMEMQASSSGQQGERIMSSPENTVSVVVDRWLSFESTALDVAQIYCLRERLSAAILFKVKHPRKVLPPALGASIYAIACILSYDGLSGISPAMESVDSLTSMVNAAGLDKTASGKQFRPPVAGGRRGMGQNPSNPSGFLKSLISDMHIRSPSNLHKSKMPQSNSMHWNDPSTDNNFPSLTPLGKHHTPQRTPFQGPSSSGATSRNGSFKRPRGSGPR
ncbi:DExH-box ATP-dependent RNA helicase DExH6 isoform X2 [Magnolia sinica]|uniref:DExH-box ATP-dependent RNA helicase DExH6 isoform X2 n=1 Tax=Magnolia sinica TaxID=86752 RepID=UPI00265A88CF|nr:DExH-box ATP-dependent RNA helicase DExH6 isoform X2 [Magnolia sinica]